MKKRKKQVETRLTNTKIVKEQIKVATTELKDGVFTYTGPLSVTQLAHKIHQLPSVIITHFFKQGKVLNVNAILNEEQIAELCVEFGYDFNHKQHLAPEDVLDKVSFKDEKHHLVLRPPVVTVMGHVDHGKTTLLDYIRKTNVAQRESGGITQHTGAYVVTTKTGEKITFLDTPGHKAFTAMRLRGSLVTDIVVLVVAAEQGVQPQTVEAIDHALAAKVPVIVFVNRFNAETKDTKRLKADLQRARLELEEWGGNTIMVQGSAKTGEGVPELLKAVLLQAEILELKANPNRLPVGVVVDSQVDKGQGVTTTVIVQNGTLHPRDFVVAGAQYGRVRNLCTPDKKKVVKAGPGTPVSFAGFKSVPEPGVRFVALDDEKFAKQLAQEKAASNKTKMLSRRNVNAQSSNLLKVKNIIIKTDVSGTAEAIRNALAHVANTEAQTQVIRAAVGEITKSDVLLAKASQASIYGFRVRSNAHTHDYAKQENVEIRFYKVIYDLVQDVEDLITKMKAPKYEEQLVGKAEILKVIFSSKVGNIAGCKVTHGRIPALAKVEVYRQDKLVQTSFLDSLQHGPNKVNEIGNKREFGCHIKNFDEVTVNDQIWVYENVRVPHKD